MCNFLAAWGAPPPLYFGYIGYNIGMKKRGRPARDRSDPALATLKRNMVAFRKARGLSQQDAAMGAGMSVDNLRRYEQVIRHPDAWVLARLGGLYGHRVEDFMSDEPPPASESLIVPFRLVVTPGIEVPPDL